MSENEAPASITLNDFLKVDIRVGEITKAELVPKSEKLMRLEVYLGELGTRTIMAGIAKSFNVDGIVGQRCLVIVNLASRKIMGVESHGMLLAGEAPGEPGEDRTVMLATCDAGRPGERIG